MKSFLIISCLFTVWVTSAQKKLNYISMQRTACFGRCPEYTVELFRDGHMVYNGKKNVDKIGRFQSGISKNSMNKFLNEIGKNKLSTLPPFYKTRASDLSRLNFIFDVNGMSNTVKNAESGPQYLSLIGKSIDSLIETVAWEETHDTVKHDQEGPELNLNVKHDHQVEVLSNKGPQFPGGIEAMQKFINEQLKYPGPAKDKRIQGTVVCTFVVLKSGKISDVKVMKGIGYGCDEEAVRIIKMMPDWKPGLVNGKTIEVRKNLPINFKLQ